MRLAQRTAVITGAGHGIGRACALAFAAEGARVMVADIDAGGAGETVRQIESAGGVAVASRTEQSVLCTTGGQDAEPPRIEIGPPPLDSDPAV